MHYALNFFFWGEPWCQYNIIHNKIWKLLTIATIDLLCQYIILTYTPKAVPSRYSGTIRAISGQITLALIE